MISAFKELVLILERLSPADQLLFLNGETQDIEEMLENNGLCAESIVVLEHVRDLCRT